MSVHSGAGDRRTDPQGPMERLTRLSEKARAFRHVIKAATRSGDRYEGRDSSGLVRLVAGATGRVEAVEIDRDRFARRGSSGLGAALFEAYQAAMTEVMTAGVERMEAAEADQPYGRMAGEPAAEASESAPSRSERFQRVTFDDVEAALRALDDRTYERQRQRSTRTATPDRVLHGRYRYVTITVRGGDIAEITVSGEVGRDQMHSLEQDALAAFQAVRVSGQ